MDRKNIEYISGCLLGGAIGDALGAPVEFSSLSQIRQRYGHSGVAEYTESNQHGLAEFTDDTQMTLFTAEGLLIALERGRERGIWNPTGSVYLAYQRWLKTQRAHKEKVHPGESGWLLGFDEMWKIKAPGNTCLSALSSGEEGKPEIPINQSKGCGGVMRAAPVGFLFTGEQAFEEGAKAAALTHGHPSGYLSAGFLSQMIAEILASDSSRLSPRQVLSNAIELSLSSLVTWPSHQETLQAVQSAVRLAEEREDTVSAEVVESLGRGWVGEEALAISIFCALANPSDFRMGVLLAINHSGDSDSTGSICGNILGAVLGINAIPRTWVDRIELKEEMIRMAGLFL